MLRDIAPRLSFLIPAVFHARRNYMFFTADDGAAGRELWVAPSVGDKFRLGKKHLKHFEKEKYK